MFNVYAINYSIYSLQNVSFSAFEHLDVSASKGLSMFRSLSLFSSGFISEEYEAKARLLSILLLNDNLALVHTKLSKKLGKALASH